jgi:hypothetical protein
MMAPSHTIVTGKSVFIPDMFASLIAEIFASSIDADSQE